MENTEIKKPNYTILESKDNKGKRNITIDFAGEEGLYSLFVFENTMQIEDYAGGITIVSYDNLKRLIEPPKELLPEAEKKYIIDKFLSEGTSLIDAYAFPKSRLFSIDEFNEFTGVTDSDKLVLPSLEELVEQADNQIIFEEGLKSLISPKKGHTR